MIALVRIVGYSLNELIKIYNIDKISQYYKLFVVLENFVSPDSNHLCYCTFCKHVVSEVQILINGFIFHLSIKCFMTGNEQLQKVTVKLNRNLPIMVVLWPHLLVKLLIEFKSIKPVIAIWTSESTYLWKVRERHSRLVTINTFS